MPYRCVLETGEKCLIANDFELPYVCSDPSIEEMHKVVCMYKLRPQINPRWMKDPVRFGN